MRFPDLFDPALGAEEVLRRKLDLRIMPFLSFLYLLSYLDRSNISNVHDIILDALHLTEAQYSLAVGIFYLGYISCEIPANLVLKKANPAYWIGSLVVAWGICSVGMAFTTDFASLATVRVFLGVAEAGFFPGVVYYLSRWYKPEEQSFRLAMFYSSSALAGTVGGLIASGLLGIEEFLGLEGWQWLFLIEGAPSVLCGMLAWYFLPSSPAKIGWLTAEERNLCRTRLYHLLPENHHEVNLGDVWRTFLNPVVWGFSLLFLAIGVPGQAKVFYAPAIISEMGYSTTESNLLSALLSFITFLYILFNGWHSDHTKERPLHLIVPILVAILGFTGLTVATYYDIPQASYAAMFLGAAQGCTLPVLLSWLGLSIRTSTERAVAAAMVISIGAFAGIIGPNLYGFLYIEPLEGEEEGSYIYGHAIMILFLIVGLGIAIILKIFVPSNTVKLPKDLPNVINDEKARGDSETSPLLKDGSA